MATLTIRNLDEDVKRDIRRAAAERGVSMEQEARDRLRLAGYEQAGPRKKATAEELIELGQQLTKEEPADPRFKTLTQKEISDLISDGEL